MDGNLTGIKITQLNNIGANISPKSLIPIVDTSNLSNPITDNGLTYDSSPLYSWCEQIWGSGGYSTTVQANNDTSIQLPISSASSPIASLMTIQIYDPSSTVNYKQINYTCSVSSADGNNYNQQGAARYQNTGAVNAFCLISRTGNINSGKFRLLGEVR